MHLICKYQQFLYNLHMELSKEQLINLIKISGIDIDPDFATNEDVTKAIVSLEKKLQFFNFPLNYLSGKNLNVLIVDDLELSIYQLTSMMSKVGVNAFVARDKTEAMDEINKKKFDYLVIDLFMPSPDDGFEIIKAANELKLSGQKDYKIVCVSGTDDKNLIQKSYTLGIDEFIPKQAHWHEDVLKFISNTINKTGAENFNKYHINKNITVFSIYKLNGKNNLDELKKEVHSEILTGRPNIIFNLENIKLFDDVNASLFVDIYKSTKDKNAFFVLVKPSEEIVKALEFVFLDSIISTFDTIENAVEYIEMNNCL